MIFKIPVNASMRNKMYSLIEWVTIEQLGTVMILLTRSIHAKNAYIE